MTSTLQRLRPSKSARSLTPAIALVLTVGALLALPLYSSNSPSLFDGYNILQNFAGLGLIALGVGLTMIAGELDLSSAGMAAFAGMLAVKAGQESVLLGLVVALVVAGLFGALQGFIIAKIRISSLPITIAGFFVLAGAVGVVGDEKSVPFLNLDLGPQLDQPIMGFFSPRSLIVVALFIIVGLFMAYTRVGRDVRAVGGDRPAAQVAGVRVNYILIGVFAASGMLCALGGAMLSYSLGVAQANVSTEPVIFAVTAALVGGVTLSGGRGSVLGIATGALSLATLQQVFAVLASPSYMQSLVFGALLFLAVTSDASGLRERVRGARVSRQLRRLRLSAVPNGPVPRGGM